MPGSPLRVGLIGTGAIARLHVRACRAIGYQVRVCTNRNEERGRAFAAEHGIEFVPAVAGVCAHPDVDYIDICTFPGYRLEAVELAARHRKHALVQKPMAVDLETARRMIDTAAQAGVQLGVVSQHRFDDASLFVSSAIALGRLGHLLQVDGYVKWHRSDEYYARPVKGSWAVEGGGALIGQGIHTVDLVRWFAGPVADVSAEWRIGATHRIESEDMVSAVLRFSSGAIGVLQASTSFWPGTAERIEAHGTRGTAVITGDRLTTWAVKDDEGAAPPLAGPAASGASDPMAISLTPFERQFQDFGESIRTGRKPLVSGAEGYDALAVVDAIYRSCRTGAKVSI